MIADPAELLIAQGKYAVTESPSDEPHMERDCCSHEGIIAHPLVCLASAASRLEEKGSRQAETVPAARIEPAPEISGARVMVIDDIADIRDLLRDYLQSEGYTVQALGDAADALSRLSEFRPQVILLDILMPGLSGTSALQRFRATHPDVQVIMVAGIGDVEVAKRTLSLGAFDYVTKPIDFAYLKWALETCLLLRPLLPKIDGEAGQIGDGLAR